MTAPTIPAATSAGRSTPSPKCAASAIPLVMTEIASAGDIVPVGDFSRVRWSAVIPVRSSRNIVTTRRISSSADGTCGKLERLAELGDPAGDDVDLLVLGRGQRQHHGVEPAAQGRRQVVHASVPVVGGGDHGESLDRLHLDAELGDRQRLLRQGS